jgi:pyruvate/2-oxoglutarate dehydrogenase complex dihydrolipoamide acyltransferase (E2) component
MPKLGLTMETALIGRWLKSPGEAIKTGEPLLEIATEKINYEIESPATGIVGPIIGKEGDEFPCGAVIGTIALDGESLRDKQRAIASPAARRLARERGIAIAEISGSGPHGRITLSDVHAFRQHQPSPLTPSAAPALPPAPPSSFPPELDAGRRAIYRKMVEIGTLPLAQVETVVRVDAVKALMERRGDFGWTAYAVYACGRLLRIYSGLRIDARTGVPFEKLDVGVAADTAGGLIVPVIRDAAARSLADIQLEILRLAKAARDGTLAAADVGGACFSISNVGPQKIERVAPLVDAPQTAILGMGAATQRPAVVDGAVVAAWMMTCVLSFDHRFIDGAPAARFLADLARVFGDPLALL